MAILRSIHPKQLLRRFRKDQRGVSALEFALIAPILITLYLGLAELTLAMMASRKVSHLAASIGDLAAQSETLTTANVDDLFEIGDDILNPYDAGNALQVRFTNVTMKASGITIDWTEHNAYWEDAELDDPAISGITVEQLPVGQSMIVTEVQYGYDSPIHSFLPMESTFKDNFYHHPRNGTAVVRKSS